MWHFSDSLFLPYHFLHSRRSFSIQHNCSAIQISYESHLKIYSLSNLAKDSIIVFSLENTYRKTDWNWDCMSQQSHQKIILSFFSQIELFKMDSDVILFKWHGRGRISTKVASFSILNRVQHTDARKSIEMDEN